MQGWYKTITHYNFQTNKKQERDITIFQEKNIAREKYKNQPDQKDKKQNSPSPAWEEAWNARTLAIAAAASRFGSSLPSSNNWNRLVVVAIMSVRDRKTEAARAEYERERENADALRSGRYGFWGCHIGFGKTTPRRNVCFLR